MVSNSDVDSDPEWSSLGGGLLVVFIEGAPVGDHDEGCGEGTPDLNDDGGAVGRGDGAVGRCEGRDGEEVGEALG